jgi:hypothetical protein
VHHLASAKEKKRESRLIHTPNRAPRYYWYKSWFAPNTTAFKPTLHIFPHWNWDSSVNSSVDVWAFSNAHEIELFVNSVSQVLETASPNPIPLPPILTLPTFRF